MMKHDALDEQAWPTAICHFQAVYPQSVRSIISLTTTIIARASSTRHRGYGQPLDCSYNPPLPLRYACEPFALCKALLGSDAGPWSWPRTLSPLPGSNQGYARRHFYQHILRLQTLPLGVISSAHLKARVDSFEVSNPRLRLCSSSNFHPMPISSPSTPPCNVRHSPGFSKVNTCLAGENLTLSHRRPNLTPSSRPTQSQRRYSSTLCVGRCSTALCEPSLRPLLVVSLPTHVMPQVGGLVCHSPSPHCLHLAFIG